MYQLEQQYAKYTSYRRPPKTQWGPKGKFNSGRGVYKLWLFLAVAVLLIVMGAGLSGNINLAAVTVWLGDGDPAHYVWSALPVWVDPGDARAGYNGYVVNNLITPVVQVLHPPAPLQILELQLPLWAAINSQQPGTNDDSVLVLAPDAMPRPDQELKLPVPPLSEQNLVALYNTHTGETYALTDGMERLNGKRGGVVKATMALEQELIEKHGISVVRSDQIHDTEYNSSYSRSQQTLRELLTENQDLQVILDIHRDAGKSRENSLVTVDGQPVAPVLIIVGSDARTSFPTWRQNHDFARELAAEINRQHPGLCIGVRIQEGRYNQFLHPRAILLEIGSVSNSTEEAVASAQLLAGPVAEIVKRYLDAREEEEGGET